MRVKLLRKLRKRFHWFMDGQNCWYYYDRKTNKKYFAYRCGMYYVNDMLIWELRDNLRLLKYYVSRRDRLAQRKKQRDQEELRQQFAKYFVK